MKTSEFYYDLPQELIAQHPLEDRTSSRLLVLDKEKERIEHKKFVDIIDQLNPGDGIVLNDSRVLPARLFGNRPGKEEKLEVLLLKRTEKNIWECLVRPGKKMKAGGRIEFGGGIIKGTVLRIGEDGTRFIEFFFEGIFEEILDQLGEMPLPPYITEKLEDGERYQTVYSKNPGSAAAPTAGLHFDKELMKKISDKGVKIIYLTLHVGLGTFRPVKVEDVNDHIMHSEYYQISNDAAEAINSVKATGGRIISVGTTSTRTLETIADEEGMVRAGSGWTDIFIYPGYRFKLVDGLITNFHLPESTLMMLVSAFAGKELIMSAYDEAIKNRYRFFSFGDSMFIK
ncbi:tRNA preQ1(34) S-adenosylmethionine ribosyltransferase-isomerase QueA [Gudongella sp. SC589]|jgi:S-adenosylmethionine:tRNA ribosyltransferase-isomerase|uniref:tRNA preQ1(34) S-adenosylmethionine ribosyltransferase-isomerase QueA n=1 Tax=Gudongella sp. SC589 TaxID=3385990 RepID=UPI0039048EA3